MNEAGAATWMLKQARAKPWRNASKQNCIESRQHRGSHSHTEDAHTCMPARRVPTLACLYVAAPHLHARTAQPHPIAPTMVIMSPSGR
eukprot:359436-Chlamydomonas_euryale.AAC.5